MKTKALTIALAAMMAAPTVTPILAEDIKSTTVNYSVAQEYQWTVPTDVTIPVANSVTVKDAVEVVKNTIPADSKLQITAKVNDSGVNQTIEKTENVVKVTKNVIPDGTALSISVAGSGEQGAFVIKNGNTALTYTVWDSKNNIEAKNVVLTVAAGTNTGSKNLTYRLTTGTGSAEVAGTYKGTVTYTASVVSSQH